MLEVELKADISNQEAAVLQQLTAFSGHPGKQQLYEDAYFDSTDHSLAVQNKELRVRTISTLGTNVTETLLTYKDPPFDSETESKPEHEVAAGDARTIEYILIALGWTVDIRFVKHCSNYNLTMDPFGILATVVKMDNVPRVFIELEIQVDSMEKVGPAKETLYSLLDRLNIPRENLTDEAYMDMARHTGDNLIRPPSE